MQLLKDIIYTILSLQERFLRYRLSKTIGVKNLSKKKRHYSNGCVLDLKTLADTEKQKLENELNNILKTYHYEPKKILEYVKAQGTEVYVVENASKYLNLVYENEGFIYPAKGAKALYLSLAIKQQFALRTSEMFVVPNGELNKYYFIYHFYNWYAYKHNIAGMDTESQTLLKKYLFQDNNTSDLQLADIFKLKDAISQDKASIEFVIKLCRNYDGAKQALAKLKNPNGANL